MKWPFVSKKEYKRLEDQYDLTLQKLKERDRQMSKLGHKLIETKRNYMQLFESLRVVRVHLDMQRPRMGKVGFSVEMPEAVFDAYRHDTTFLDALSYYIEHAMMTEPEGRALLAGIYDRPTP